MRESKDSWGFFSTWSKMGSENIFEQITVLDRSKGIVTASANIYSDQEHFSCAHHIFKLSKTALKEDSQGTIIWLRICKKATTGHGYKEKLAALQAESQKGAACIANLNQQTWARYAWNGKSILSFARRTIHVCKLENAHLPATSCKDLFCARNKIVELQTDLVERGKKQAHQMVQFYSFYTRNATKSYGDVLNRASGYNAVTKFDSKAVFFKRTRSINNLRHPCWIWDQETRMIFWK